MTTPEKPMPDNEMEKEMSASMAPEAMEAKNDPFAKGRERMAAIGGFFSKMKEKAASMSKRVGSTISRVWGKTKSASGEVGAAIFSGDELAKRGAQFVGAKAEQADAYVTEKVDQGAKFVADKTVEGAKWVGDKAEQGGEWIGEKAEQLGNFAEATYEKGAEFVSTKAEQIKDFAQDKVELAKDVAFYAKEKTAENLAKAKAGIENRYNKIKAFGENAMMSAKIEIARRKEAYRMKMNDIRQRRLQAEFERVSQAESATSARAEELRKQKEKLAEALGLQNNLNTMAA